MVVTFFRDANIAGTLAAGLARRPVVSTRRNLGWWHTPREVAVLRVLDRMTARFVANSEAVAERTRAVERLDPRRIEVIPNAVDTGRFRPPEPGEREAARRALGLDGNAPVVGCVGNLRPVKDHRGLLAAWERVRARLPEARLILVGSGPEEGALRELAAPFGESVRFLGAREDVPALLRAFDLGVLPSMSEGSSNALLEYLASGLPAAATAVGGSPEILAGRGFGRLVPSGDPSALAGALIQAALERAGFRPRGGGPTPRSGHSLHPRGAGSLVPPLRTLPEGEGSMGESQEGPHPQVVRVPDPVQPLQGADRGAVAGGDGPQVVPPSDPVGALGPLHRAVRRGEGGEAGVGHRTHLDRRTLSRNPLVR